MKCLRRQRATRPFEPIFACGWGDCLRPAAQAGKQPSTEGRRSSRKQSWDQRDPCPFAAGGTCLEALSRLVLFRLRRGERLFPFRLAACRLFFLLAQLRFLFRLLGAVAFGPLLAVVDLERHRPPLSSLDRDLFVATYWLVAIYWPRRNWLSRTTRS